MVNLNTSVFFLQQSSRSGKMVATCPLQYTVHKAGNVSIDYCNWLD